VGYWESVDELRENWRVDREFDADPEGDVDARYGRWQEAVERSRGWATEDGE
jgi:glycerol kinase